MAQTTAIEWTDLSWNPTHGCSKVSPGCAHCYAETLSRRYHQTPKPWTPANAAENVTLKPHKLREPLSNARAWRGLGRAAAAAGKTDGKLVFVNSMSDLFHEEVPNAFIYRVFEIMREARRHTFQVLTKRPERMRALLSDWASREVAMAPGMPWWKPPENVWLGTSIENRRYVHRADLLRQTPAAVRFISAEPLLGPLLGERAPHEQRDGNAMAGGRWSDGFSGPELGLRDIAWLIAGGESGPQHRPVDPQWVRELRDYAAAAGTAFFFKQWGGSRPGGEALLDGREWREFPQVGT